MPKYKVLFEFDNKVHELVTDRWVVFKDGFWVTDKMKLGVSVASKYWIPPHAIQHIEKL